MPEIILEQIPLGWIAYWDDKPEERSKGWTKDDTVGKLIMNFPRDHVKIRNLAYAPIS